MMRLAHGERINCIASDLFLSPKTVSTHRRRLLDKLGLSSNVELGLYALQHGLVD
jgi:DNA-binding NarL/FixJ family response regulator